MLPLLLLSVFTIIPHAFCSSLACTSRRISTGTCKWRILSFKGKMTYYVNKEQNGQRHILYSYFLFHMYHFHPFINAEMLKSCFPSRVDF